MTILLFLAPVPTATAFPFVVLDTTTAGFVGMAASGPLDQAVIVHDFAEFTATFGASTAGLANPYLAPSVAGFFANGGTQVAVVRVAAVDDATVIGIDGGAPGTSTGLQALLDIDEVSFIAIPGVATPTVQAAMISHCENAGDRMAILDPASPNDLNAIQVQRAGLATDNGFAALYFPWIQAEPTGTSLLLPPSGFVAGFYSANDPDDSPVGIIATATDVAYPVSSIEQDILNPQGINAIRDLSGIRIWGARTLAGSVEWKYVSTRRQGSFIEDSTIKSTLWFVFELNGPVLWTALEQDTEDFLFGLWADGWLQGTQPSDAYFVQCGLGLTMTQADIDEGRVIIRIGFAPQAPAEFILIDIVHQWPDLSGVPATATGMVFHPAAPNPFNPATELRFALDNEENVSLTIFDAAGRRVRTLAENRSFAAGEHRLAWDGRDDSGRALGSGIFLARIAANGESRVQKLALVR